MLAGATRDKGAVGQDHVGFEEVVDGQPELAGQVPGAAAQSEPGHPGGGDDPERYESLAISRWIASTAAAAGAVPTAAYLPAARRFEPDPLGCLTRSLKWPRAPQTRCRRLHIL
jgi:hypothetical protein